MVTDDDGFSAPVQQEEVHELQLVGQNALKTITEAEMNTGIDIAKRYPRDPMQCKKTVLQLAAADRETAEACFFVLPRKKKNNDTGKMEDANIEGESIRLAEIVATSWKNIRYGTRIINVDKVNKTITAQAMVMDLENNITTSIEETKNIAYKDGKIYNQDMITMTGKAAQSIALRNAIFKAVPKAFFSQVMKEIKQVAIGNKPGYMEDGKDFKPVPIADRIQKAIKFFTNWGISEARIFSVLSVTKVEEITEEHLITLTGLKSGINSGDVDLITAFPITEAEKSASVGATIISSVKDKKEKAEKNKSAVPDGDPSKLTEEEKKELAGQK